MNDNLTLKDLVHLSGLTLRTLRYYMQEGLLPGPDTHGKYAKYSQQHLDRLEIIQRLKNLRLPLQEIHQILDNMTPEEASRIRQDRDNLKQNRTFSLRERDKKTAGKNYSSNALDYIQNLERGRESVRTLTSQSPGYLPAPLPPVDYPKNNMGQSDLAKASNQEAWTRIILRDGIELNIRHPKDQEEQKRIKQLILFAQKLFRDQRKREK